MNLRSFPIFHLVGISPSNIGDFWIDAKTSAMILNPQNLENQKIEAKPKVL
jgi:hypothetical protein